MAKALLSAFPNKFDLFSFVPFIQDEVAAVQTCYHLGLIPNVLVCVGKGISPAKLLGGYTTILEDTQVREYV
jgi:hypothetical protein